MIEEFPNQPKQPPRQRGSGRLAVALMAFAMGAGAMGFGAWQNGWRPQGLAQVLPHQPPKPQASATQAAQTLEGRLATLEQHLRAIEADAAIAGAQSGRAEALLVAIATRRAIERGMPLAYLEGQLRLRFGAALPDVVNTIVNFAHQPITQDRLAAQLDAMAPRLTGPQDQQTSWNKVTHDLSDLFVLHSDNRPTPPSAQMRLDHARLCLREGRIEDAIADVRLLPGATQAAGWLADAKRYAEVMHALDAIDTAALLEPKLLRDASGRMIDQASPVVSPLPAVGASAASPK
jgi:hypothetical protein